MDVVVADFHEICRCVFESEEGQDAHIKAECSVW